MFTLIHLLPSLSVINLLPRFSVVPLLMIAYHFVASSVLSKL